jgi:hypothetical protein
MRKRRERETFIHSIDKGFTFTINIMPPRRRRRRNSSSIPPDTIDDIRRKITDQKEKIIRDFHSLNLNNCNNLFNKWGGIVE